MRHVLVLLVDLAWLVSAIWMVVSVIRRSGVSRGDKVAWGVSAFALPVISLVAWLIFLGVANRRASSR